MFQTDLSDARRAIQYEWRTYTGALVYDSETKQAVRVKDAPVEYFGPPGNEIDAAWDELLRGIMRESEQQIFFRLTLFVGEFIYMTEEEAAPFKPELRKIPPKNVYMFECVTLTVS